MTREKRGGNLGDLPWGNLSVSFGFSSCGMADRVSRRYIPLSIFCYTPLMFILFCFCWWLHVFFHKMISLFGGRGYLIIRSMVGGSPFTTISIIISHLWVIIPSTLTKNNTKMATPTSQTPFGWGVGVLQQQLNDSKSSISAHAFQW